MKAMENDIRDLQFSSYLSWIVLIIVHILIGMLVYRIVTLENQVKDLQTQIERISEEIQE